MEFLLTSTIGGVENQIPNAIIKKYKKVDVRYFSSFEEFDKLLSRMEGNWLSKGVNHKTSKGRIQREFPNGAEGHFIEINSIEELLEFHKKVGSELIITSATNNESIPAIEIYNYYRE
ncbi:MAG: hypothetical protein E6392_11525 [Staphylococcus epidermidis]|jgi:hypothetical protein|nr:hypothetical protein [Staphylococcus epidermidis]